MQFSSFILNLIFSWNLSASSLTLYLPLYLCTVESIKVKNNLLNPTGTKWLSFLNIETIKCQLNKLIYTLKKKNRVHYKRQIVMDNFWIWELKLSVKNNVAQPFTLLPAFFKFLSSYINKSTYIYKLLTRILFSIRVWRTVLENYKKILTQQINFGVPCLTP